MEGWRTERMDVWMGNQGDRWKSGWMGVWMKNGGRKNCVELLCDPCSLYKRHRPLPQPSASKLHIQRQQTPESCTEWTWWPQWTVLLLQSFPWLQTLVPEQLPDPAGIRMDLQEVKQAEQHTPSRPREAAAHSPAPMPSSCYRQGEKHHYKQQSFSSIQAFPHPTTAKEEYQHLLLCPQVPSEPFYREAIRTSSDNCNPTLTG